MEIKFNNNPDQPAQTVSAAPATATQAPPVAPPTAAMAVRKSLPVGKADNFLMGDLLPGFGDIILPRVALSQNIGTLRDLFVSGSVVLDRKVALFVPPEIKDGKVTREATPPVTLTVVGFRPTRFVEKIVGSADRGQIVKTERDVALAGGTLDWAEWNLKKGAGMKLFQPMADAFLVIERPASLADDNTNFYYEADGKFLALALWAMKGTAYTAAAKRVFFTGRRIGILRDGGYPSWSFTLATREDKFPGGNKAWVPVCLPKEKNSPAFLAFIKDVLSTPAAEATDDEAAEAAAEE
jgi:hypothetical protein